MIDITADGAVGDGATDCTDAIQGALDAAAAAGETVLVPEGRFLVRGLAVPNGVRGIQGVSPASYTNHRTGSVLELRREGAAQALLDLSDCKDLFCRDLALVGFGRGGDGGRWTPDYSLVLQGLQHSAFTGNSLWGCAMKEAVVDLGGHGEGFLFEGNAVSLATGELD